MNAQHDVLGDGVYGRCEICCRGLGMSFPPKPRRFDLLVRCCGVPWLIEDLRSPRSG